jgi:hypothetical protein
MRTLVILGVLITFTVRGILVYIDDAAIKGDIALLPNFSNVSEVKAQNIAIGVKKRCAESQCELVPGTLHVDVGSTYLGRLKVYGSGMAVASGKPIGIQDIHVTLTCKRKGALFVRTSLSLDVQTQGMGEGAEDHLVE